MRPSAAPLGGPSLGGPSLGASLVQVALTLLLMLGLSGCAAEPAPRKPVRESNALWLGVEWLHAPQTAAAITALAADLERRHIDRIYVYATYLRADGTFSPTYEHAADFTRQLRAAYPGASIQAWMGLPLAHTTPLSNIAGHVQLDDAPTRAQIVALGTALLAQGRFDGLHLDPEPVRSGDAALLQLLAELRAACPPEATLSIAARRIALAPALAELDALAWYAWSPAYYGAVARQVDEIAVMTYDSALPLASLYWRFVRRQVIVATRTLAGEDVRLYMGVPTSEERTLTHWPRAENMTSGLEGVLAGLEARRAVPDALAGVAIYPHWETDEAEWAVYEGLWLRGAAGR